jgi:ring-1,2-phenylacetyl-CoA epoxidase subunit PaaA
MGVLPEREWILRAPTLKRKLALSAKVQDEVGHAQLLYRVAEDLGKPREDMLADLLAGKTKFHNVFHYPTRSWADVGIIAWLVDAAAIVAQQALRESSYAPYGRTMKKICWEESVHILHGRDVVLTMMNGTGSQRALVQDALERWWGPLMQMHGPRTDPGKDRDLAWRIKNKDNETLRQEFLTVYVPRIREIGLEPPDPELGQDDTGRWLYTEPDWKELYAVVTGHGPRSAERLELRRLHYAETQWVRDTVMAAPRAA